MSEVSAGEPTLVGAAWRFRVMVLAGVLLCLAAGLVYAETRPTSYVATGSLVLEDPRSAAVFANPSPEAPDRYLGDQITVLKSLQLAAAAAKAGTTQNPPVNLSADYFQTHTTITGVPLNGNLVQIAFTATDSGSALSGLNAIETAYEQVVQSSVKAELASVLAQIDADLSPILTQLNSVATQLAAAPPTAQPALLQQQQSLLVRRDALAQKRDQVLVDASSGSNGVALTLPPEAPKHNSKLVTGLPILAIAAVLGLIVGVIVAYVVASRYPVFRNRDEPESVLGAPLVAEIPRFTAEINRFDRLRPLSGVSSNATPASSAFRRAALAVQTRPTGMGRSRSRRTAGRSSEETARRLVVVSAARQEGRSTVVANLGMAFADSGLRVVVIDADPRTGGLTNLLRGYFQSIPVRGRADLGQASMSLEGLTRPGRSRGRLSLLRLGQIVIGEGQADRDRILTELESEWDVVLIDAPPVNDLGSYLPLVRRAEAALVVVDHGTSVASLEDVARLLSAIEMPPAGYIYNHRPHPRRKASEILRPQRAVAVDRDAGLPPNVPAQSGGASLAG